jgi:cobalt-zinc-cadmium efflux system membrane fusion protein
MNYKILTILSLFFAFTSCKNNTTETKNAEETKTEEKAAAELHLTDAQIKAIDLQLGSFEYKNLTTTLKINGKLSLPPQHQAEVSILNGGVVKSIAVQEGQFVNAGKTLAIIANTEVIQLQQDYLENSANLTYLENILDLNLD